MENVMSTDEKALRVFLAYSIRMRKKKLKRRVEFRKRLLKYMLEEKRQTTNFWYSIIIALRTYKAPIIKTVWSKQRSTYWWECIVKETWNDDDWEENFRVTKDTFNYVLEQLEPSLRKITTSFRQPIPADKRLAISLWRLSTNVEFSTLAHLFGVGRSSTFQIVKQVCSAIAKVLLPKYLNFPQGDELNRVVEGYEQIWGFPQCVSAIGGTHIPVKKPIENPHDSSRKSIHSIVLQATVDYKYCFTSANVGWPGSIQDAWIFANSKLFKNLESGNLLPNKPKRIGTAKVPLLLIGDSSYPLLPYLMKPYPETSQNTLTQKQKNFNQKLNKARLPVKDAFRMLKGRWRCLQKPNDTNIKDLSMLILACCVLHNICEARGDCVRKEWLESLATPNDSILHDVEFPHRKTMYAVTIRNAIANSLYDK